VYGFPFPEPKYLQFREDVNKAIYRDPSVVERLQQFAADKPLSLILLDASLWAAPIPRNDMDVLLASPINTAMMCLPVERVHVKIHLNSRRVTTAAVATSTPVFRKVYLSDSAAQVARGSPW